MHRKKIVGSILFTLVVMWLMHVKTSSADIDTVDIFAEIQEKLRQGTEESETWLSRHFLVWKMHQDPKPISFNDSELMTMDPENEVVVNCTIKTIDELILLKSVLTFISNIDIWEWSLGPNISGQDPNDPSRFSKNDKFFVARMSVGNTLMLVETTLGYEMCTIISSRVDIPSLEDEDSVDQLERILHVKSKRAFVDKDTWFNDYRSEPEILEFMRQLELSAPDLVEFIPSIGKSYKEKDIAALRIRKPGANPTKTVFFSGGVHAREWVSITTVLFLMKELVTGYSRGDEEILGLLDHLEFAAVPLVNPDGYTYSWHTDRLWRKNLRNAPSGYGGCPGVDLNRNFDNHWGGVGASRSPCSSEYRGTSAASESEVQVLQTFVMKLKNRSAAIDFHAYGQLILRSFGYTMTPAKNEEQLKRIGDRMAEIIFEYSGSVYTSEQASGLYPTTGSTDDWYTEQAGMWGWTIELRDLGKYHFKLPANQIIPTGKEIWEAMKYFFVEVIENGPVSN